MEETRESRYTRVGTRPWWVKLSPFLAGLWEDPVFRRNYARTRVKNIVSPKVAFFFGLGVSFVMMVISMALAGMDSEAIGIAMVTGVLVPTGLLTAITYLRMFLTCLTTTSIELRRDMDDGSLHLVFTTPKTDAGIYYAECLPSFMKGLEVINSLLAVFVGTLIPLAIAAVHWILNNPGDIPGLFRDDTAMVILSVILGAFFILSGLILMMLLFSLTSGLYALTMPTFGAVFATLIHYGVINWLSWFITAFFIELMENFFNYQYSFGNEFAIMYGVIFIKTALVIVGCIITGRIGINTFAKVRRQGYYEPEHASAAGLNARL